MQLSHKIIAQFDKPGNFDSLIALPEKVLQFGTGVLLRGLPDYFIDKANKQNIFNGRIVVVKSTNTGNTDVFTQQDGLFTLLERGVEEGRPSETITINAAISRVLSAAEEWDAILQCAANPEMQIIISNTTELGIVLVESDAFTIQPVSFPGRLLSFLQTRYNACNGSMNAGMVIIPTELIVDNGDQLKSIVLTMARLKNVDNAFLEWLQNANEFCNSLVDRIVPGKLPAPDQAIMEQQLGYRDELMIMSESYRFWAIETKKERTKDILSFSKADKGVILAPDINKFRELKLRLLNGTHTLSCGLACLAGFATVKDAMDDPAFAAYISHLMLREIAPLVVQNTISIDEANYFALQVIERFKNPYIRHQWLSITVQYTSKMVTRTVPLLEKYYTLHRKVPELMALGFASFILFMRPTVKIADSLQGNHNGTAWAIQDDKAAWLAAHWQSGSEETIADNVLKDTAIFGKDLTQFKGFAEAVQRCVHSLIEQGAAKTLCSGINLKMGT